tara:strand:+ start:7068 stop:8102 length:1035 start_codon:yes stop_codon:yes gene_type:complete
MKKIIDISIEEDQSDADNRRKNGEFVRSISGFRNKIGDNDFPAEPDRYHLFVALNCPWCHRTIIARSILGLKNTISIDVVFPNRTEKGDTKGANKWHFSPEKKSTLTNSTLKECTRETGTGKDLKYVSDIYSLEGSNEQSLPILYDKYSKRIVSNESSDIVKMFNFNAKQLGSYYIQKERPNLYPNDKSKEINSLNKKIYTQINNGAYKAGFSSNQIIYSEAFDKYFEALSFLETSLENNRRPFLTGDFFTASDLWLFPTLYRHDPIYFLRMKLNRARIIDYPYLWQWLCRVYSLPEVADSCSLLHCRQGYFGRSGNCIIPIGPEHPMPYPKAYNHPEIVVLKN